MFFLVQTEPLQCENPSLNSNNNCVTELTNFLSTQHVQEEDLGTKIAILLLNSIFS